MRALEELSCPNKTSLSPFNTSPMRFTEERRWKRGPQAGITSPQTILFTSYVVHRRRKAPPASSNPAQRARIRKSYIVHRTSYIGGVLAASVCPRLPPRLRITRKPFEPTSPHDFSYPPPLALCIFASFALFPVRPGRSGASSARALHLRELRSPNFSNRKS